MWDRLSLLYGSGLYHYISLVELLEKITTQHAFNVFFTSHRDYPVRIRKIFDGIVQLSIKIKR